MKAKRLIISISGKCQYRCDFCIYSGKRRKTSLNPAMWEDVLYVARKNGFSVLEIGGRGEPALSSEFLNITALAKKMGYQIELLSNGQNPDILCTVLPMIRKLTLNLNATSEKGFSEIHRPLRGGGFESCKANIRRVLGVIKESRLPVELRINFVVYKTSLKESILFPLKINEMFLSDLMAGKMIFVSYQYMHHYILDVMKNIKERKRLELVLSLWDRQSKKYFFREHTNLGVFLESVRKLLSLKTPLQREHPCDVYKTVRFVDNNGDVFACYNPFRVVCGMKKEKDCFYCGNLLLDDASFLFSDRWRPGFSVNLLQEEWSGCLACPACKF